MQLEWFPCPSFSSVGGAYLPAHWLVEDLTIPCEVSVPPSFSTDYSLPVHHTMDSTAGGAAPSLFMCSGHTLKASSIPPLVMGAGSSDVEAARPVEVSLPTDESENGACGVTPPPPCRGVPVVKRSSIYLTEYAIPRSKHLPGPLGSGKGEEGVGDFCTAADVEVAVRQLLANTGHQWASNANAGGLLPFPTCEVKPSTAPSTEREGWIRLCSTSDFSVVVEVKAIPEEMTSPEVYMLCQSHRLFLIAVWVEERERLHTTRVTRGEPSSRTTFTEKGDTVSAKREPRHSIFVSTGPSLARAWLQRMLQRTAAEYAVDHSPNSSTVTDTTGTSPSSAMASRRGFFRMCVQLPIQIPPTTGCSPSSTSYEEENEEGDQPPPSESSGGGAMLEIRWWRESEQKGRSDASPSLYHVQWASSSSKKAVMGTTRSVEEVLLEVLQLSSLGGTKDSPVLEVQWDRGHRSATSHQRKPNNVAARVRLAGFPLPHSANEREGISQNPKKKQQQQYHPRGWERYYSLYVYSTLTYCLEQHVAASFRSAAPTLLTALSEAAGVSVDTATFELVPYTDGSRAEGEEGLAFLREDADVAGEEMTMEGRSTLYLLVAQERREAVPQPGAVPPSPSTLSAKATEVRESEKGSQEKETTADSDRKKQVVVAVMRFFAPVLGSRYALLLLTPTTCRRHQLLSTSVSRKNAVSYPLTALSSDDQREEEVEKEVKMLTQLLQRFELQHPVGSRWSPMCVYNYTFKTSGTGSSLDRRPGPLDYWYYRQRELVLLIVGQRTRAHGCVLTVVPTPNESLATLGSLTVFYDQTIAVCTTSMSDDTSGDADYTRSIQTRTQSPPQRYRRFVAVCTLLEEGRSAAEYLEYYLSVLRMNLETNGFSTSLVAGLHSSPMMSGAASFGSTRSSECRVVSEVWEAAELQRLAQEGDGESARQHSAHRGTAEKTRCPMPFERWAFTSTRGNTAASVATMSRSASSKYFSGCVASWISVVCAHPPQKPSSGVDEARHQGMKMNQNQGAAVPETHGSDVEEPEEDVVLEEKLLLIRECGLGALLVIQMQLPPPLLESVSSLELSEADVKPPTRRGKNAQWKRDMVSWAMTSLFACRVVDNH